MNSRMHRMLRPVFIVFGLALVLSRLASGVACAQLAEVKKAEQVRIAVIEKLRPSVVAIFAPGGNNGGTGVLISEDGYALTNFHVVQPTGPTPKCGLPDGYLYDAVVVGIDKVGDVALIKLLPREPGQKFPAAVIGDSDTVREGDWSIAMGNPFLLATDFTPTVTFGLVSGVHRYQPPAGVLLEYTDCIQIDTSINPGNSGGPLFSMQGELIGINGRGSFDKRGRVNSGVGYAISINQIKNFMGHLRAGLDVDHASLGATMRTESEKAGLVRMSVDTILEESDAFRRGLDLDDEILSFAGRPIASVNQLKNVLGLYPRDWRLPIEFRREKKSKETLVRLMGIQRKVTDASGVPQKAPPVPKRGPDGKPMPMPKSPVPKASGPGAKLYEAKTGFANYYFNRASKDALLAGFRKNGDFASVGGAWQIDGAVRLLKNRTESDFRLEIGEEKTGTVVNPMVRLKVENFAYAIDPLSATKEEVRHPTQSGGLMAALFLWRHMLVTNEKGFSNETHHGGVEPFYPPVETKAAGEGKAAPSVGSTRIDCEVINANFGPYITKWFFHPNDRKLLGMEMRLEANEDPCEVYFSDYKAVDGRSVPHRFQVYYRDVHYGTFTMSSIKQAASK